MRRHFQRAGLYILRYLQYAKGSALSTMAKAHARMNERTWALHLIVVNGPHFSFTCAQYPTFSSFFQSRSTFLSLTTSTSRRCHLLFFPILCSGSLHTIVATLSPPFKRPEDIGRPRSSFCCTFVRFFSRSATLKLLRISTLKMVLFHVMALNFFKINELSLLTKY